MGLTTQDVLGAQKVFDAYQEYRKSVVEGDEDTVSYTKWFKKIRHQYITVIPKES